MGLILLLNKWEDRISTCCWRREICESVLLYVALYRFVVWCCGPVELVFLSCGGMLAWYMFIGDRR